jgi:hypothetical protein
MSQNSKIDRRCKLTDDDVQLILSLDNERHLMRQRMKALTVDAICDKFGISHSYYYNLINGDNRRNFTGAYHG